MPSEDRPRLFVAVLLPESVRERIAGVAARLQPFRTNVSIVRKENFHVTLKFMGETDVSLLDRATGVIRSAAVAQAPFDAAISGWGAFPNARKARVVWAGVSDGAEQLRSLSRGVEKGLAALGFEDENRFRPHVTIGRVRNPDRSGRLAELLAEEIGPLGGFTVTDVHLMKSTLAPGGALYESLESFPLKDLRRPSG